MKAIVTTLFCAVAVFGCDNKPTEGKPQAQVGEAVTTPSANASAAASAPATAAAVETLAVSQTNSSLEFVGAKVTGKHDGKFETFSGTVSLNPEKVEASSVKIDIDLASVKTDDEKLDGHLKAPDFFDVAKFAKASFESTAIVAEKGANGETHKITGNLDFHGVKKSISFPATITVSPTELQAKAEFGLNRMDFEVKYPGKQDDLIKDDVLIKLNLKLPRSK